MSSSLLCNPHFVSTTTRHSSPRAASFKSFTIVALLLFSFFLQTVLGQCPAGFFSKPGYSPCIHNDHVRLFGVGLYDASTSVDEVQEIDIAALGVSPLEISSYSHNLMLTTNYQLWSMGDHTYKQLCRTIGGTSDQNFVRITTGAVGTKLVHSACAGVGYSIIALQDGTYAGCGRNHQNQLGQGATSGDQETPLAITLPGAASGAPKMLTCGASSTAVIDASGEVYLWGRHHTEDIASPTHFPLPNSDKAIRIALGDTHALVLTSSGEIYGMGNNADYQLGIGSTVISADWNLVSFFTGKQISHISCGLFSSIAYSYTTNTLYGFGRNYYGQTGSWAALIYPPEEFTNLPPLKELFPFEGHSLLLTESGLLYSSGLNEDSQSVGNTGWDIGEFTAFYEDGSINGELIAHAAAGQKSTLIVQLQCFQISAKHPEVCGSNGVCVAHDTCSCDPGFTGPECLSKLCYGVAEDNSTVCSGHGDCSAVDTCTCSGDYSGPQCSEFSCGGIPQNDPSVCTNGHGTCSAPNNCECLDGYSGANCEVIWCYGKASMDGTVCSGHGTCDSLDVCLCAANYFGAECDTTQCFGTLSNASTVCGGHGTCSGSDICNCYSSYSGSQCTETTCGGVSSADPSVCNSRGTCSIHDSCECDVGYFGDNCENSGCNGVLSTEAHVCNGHGDCVGLDDCDCDEGYSGVNCELVNCFGQWGNSSTSVCSGHGDCIDVNSCECSTGYSGQQCEFVLCHGVWSNDPSVCSGNGACTAPDTCECDDAFSGSQCEGYGCFGTLHSDPSVCSSHGTCNSPNSCSCSADFYGQQCDMFDCHGVAKNDSTVCSSHGTCTAPNSCTCSDAYTGTQCNEFSCFGTPSNAAGVCSDRGTCQSPDSCSCSTGYDGLQCELVICQGALSNSSDICSGRGSCTSPNSCSCSSGYTGSDCEFYICDGFASNDSNACSAHGTCVDVGQCSCQTGYGGDNCEQSVCNGKLESDPTVCSSRGQCVTPGVCDCVEGYHGDDCTTPECFGVLGSDGNVCNGHGSCQNFDQCACSSGFSGEQCGIPVCFGKESTASGVCSSRGTCVAPNQCDCDTNYLGQECEVAQCFGELSNSSSVCNGHGDCPSFGQCNCNTGYAGSECELFVCPHGILSNETGTVCSGNGDCTAPGTCVCSGVYVGFDCSQTYFTCNGIAYNDESACSQHGQCIFTDTCKCDDGYTGDECEIPICFGVIGSADDTCSGHGTCLDYNTCSCESGFYGASCNVTTCNGILSNVSSVCSSHGTCQLSGECECAVGYVGDLCEVPICHGVLGNTTQNLCSGHGSCAGHDSCICSDGYLGEVCNITTCGNVLSNDTANVCSGQGECSPDGTCICGDGYTGALCDIPICFGKLANETACSGHGSCHSRDACDCDSVYTGYQCEITTCGDVLSNLSTTCSGHGICMDHNQCDCQEGYTGSLCETPLCFDNRADDAAVCSGHGSCNSHNMCQCSAGYLGVECNLTTCAGILSIDSSIVCSGSGTCSSKDVCDCHSGFSGVNCEIPSCGGVWSNQSTVCNGHGLCTNLDTCECSTSFYGDNCEKFDCFGDPLDSPAVCSGHGSCVAPDECSCASHFTDAQCSTPDCIDGPTSCSSHGTCDPNTFECVCESGYSSANCSDYTCGGASHLDSQVCSGHGSCQAVDMCQCEAGFSGDNCEKAQCSGLDNDDAFVCSGHGTCVQPTVCECVPGYTSSNCSVPVCFGERSDSALVCSGRGTCVDADHCVCSGHAMGTNCSECAIGWNGNSCSVQQSIVPVMRFSSVVSSCESVQIDASESYAHDEDDSEVDINIFQWDVLSSPNIANLTPIVQSFTGSILRLDAHQLSEGEHRFALRVGTSLDALSAQSVVAVRKLNYSVATASIVGPSMRYTFAGQAFSLKGAIFAPCGGVESASVQWKQMSGPVLPISMFYQEGLHLVFPTGFLRTQATYVFQLSASSHGVSSSQSVQVSVLMRDLIAQLNDTSRAVVRGESFYLSSNSSVDPETSSEMPQYSLTCVYSESEEPCGADDIEQTTTGGWRVTPRSNLRLSLVFSKGDRVSRPYTVEYIVQEAPGADTHLPTVRIETTRTKINRNDRLVLIGKLESVPENEATVVEWTCSDSSLLTESNLRSSTTSLTLILKPQTLNHNVTRFTLTATHSSGGTSFAFIDIELNAPPKSTSTDSFNVVPSSGTVLNTQFTAVFRTWRDADLPLAYRLTYKHAVTGAERIIQAYTETNTIQFQVPQPGCSSRDYELQVRGYIRDALGAETVIETTIQVLPINFADAQDWLTFALNYLTEDFSPPPLELLAVEPSWISVISSVADLVCANCSSVALLGNDTCHEGETCIANQLFDLEEYQTFQIRALSHLFVRLHAPTHDELKKILSSIECMSRFNTHTMEFLHLSAQVLNRISTDFMVPSDFIPQIVSILSSLTTASFASLESENLRTVYDTILHAFENTQHQHVRNAIAGEILIPVLTDNFKYAPVKDHAFTFKELTKIRQKRVELGIPLIFAEEASLAVSPAITTHFDLYEPLSGLFTYFYRSPFYDHEVMQDMLSNTYRYEILSDDASQITIDGLTDQMRIHMPVFATRSDYSTTCKNYDSERHEWVQDCTYEFKEDIGLGVCLCPLTSLRGLGIFADLPLGQKRSSTDTAYLWVIGVFTLLAPFIIIVCLCCIFCGLACLLKRRRNKKRVQAQTMITQRFSHAVLNLTSVNAMRLTEDEKEKDEVDEIFDAGVKHMKDDLVEAAYEHFMRASEMGSKKAQIELGKMHLEGYDTLVPQDFTVAEHYFQLAGAPVDEYIATLDPVLQERWRGIKEENTDDLVEIGKKYLQGKDVKYSAQTGRMYLEKAAAKNDTRAINILAKMYREGLGGIEQNIGKCLELYHRSAELGNVEAMFNLGVLYASSKFGVRDYDDALKWMTLAKSHGVKKAPQRVRLIKFEIEFENMWNRANQDDPDAIATLASWYLRGKVSDEEPSEVLLEPDPQQAVDLLKKGSQLKNVDCTIQLANLHRQGFYVKKSHRRAVHLYKKCLPSPIAAFNLALMYERGLPRYDFEKALSLYWHAYNGGVIEAKQGIDRTRAEKYRIYLLNRRIFKPFIVTKQEQAMGTTQAALQSAAKRYFPSSTSSSQRRSNIMQPEQPNLDTTQQLE